MSAMTSPAQSEFYAGLLPVEPSVEAPAVRPADLKNDPFPNRRPSLGKRALRALGHFLVTFCVGVAATLAWQSYGDVAREMIANSSPQLGWLAPPAAPAGGSPDQQQLNAMSLDLDAVRQNIDRIAISQEQITRSVDQIAPSIVASEEQMTRHIDRIAASQERIARSVDQLAEAPSSC